MTLDGIPLNVNGGGAVLIKLTHRHRPPFRFPSFEDDAAARCLHARHHHHQQQARQSHEEALAAVSAGGAAGGGKNSLHPSCEIVAGIFQSFKIMVI